MTGPTELTTATMRAALTSALLMTMTMMMTMTHPLQDGGLQCRDLALVVTPVAAPGSLGIERPSKITIPSSSPSGPT